MCILREFYLWIIDILQNERFQGTLSTSNLFSVWEECSLEKGELLRRFFLGNNGIVKGWYDGCEYTPEGLKKKEVVQMTFIDYMTYKYANGTSDWSYISEPYVIGGYGSKMEQYVGELTQQGLEQFAIGTLDARQIGRVGTWLTRNIFSIVGVI